MIWPGLVTARTTYAIRALGDLAIAAPRSVRGRDLAQSHRIQPSYLYEVLAALRRGELVSCDRGPSGGFRLTRPAATISIADVVRTLGIPPMAGPALVHHVSAGDELGPRLWKLWIAAGDATMRVLEEVSVADLIGRRTDLGSPISDRLM